MSLGNPPTKTGKEGRICGPAEGQQEKHEREEVRMCKHGNEVICRVPIHPEDSHTGKMYWADKAIDACLADRVNELNASGKFTRVCCCGHGQYKGSIILHDGTDGKK